jgi:hypothetical protein
MIQPPNYTLYYYNTGKTQNVFCKTEELINRKGNRNNEFGKKTRLFPTTFAACTYILTGRQHDELDDN